jgi:hypothetical protein
MALCFACLAVFVCSYCPLCVKSNKDLFQVNSLVLDTALSGFKTI